MRLDPEDPLPPRLPAPPFGKRLWVYDCEVFPNHFLCVLCDGQQWQVFDETSIPALVRMVTDSSLILTGFNNVAYDDLLLRHLVINPHASASDIHQLSHRIISPEQPGQTTRQPVSMYEPMPWGYSIDVFQLLNGRGGLKEWECREGLPLVAECPVDFRIPCPDQRRPEVLEYCRNDVVATMLLLLKYWPLVEMREALASRFSLDTRVFTLTEPRLAQHTFMTLHQRRTGQSSRQVRALASANPDNLRTHFEMQELLSPTISLSTPAFTRVYQLMRQGRLIGSDDGRIWSITVEDLDMSLPVPLAGTAFALGIGGLHSIDRPGVDVADEEWAICDLDVTSYYPSLIIAEGLYPRQLGPAFVSDLLQLRDQRLAAKRAGDKMTADALKIIINSVYGKLNDRWSPLRSVIDAHRVTVNGQWFLLMLIEALYECGATVISANTDGVTIRSARRNESILDAAISRWQEQTSLSLERTEFRRLCRRDVNSYIARTIDGRIKSKGAFNSDSGKGDGKVIKQAAAAFLLDDIDPILTIQAEEDPTAFLFYQRAKNGGTLFHGDEQAGQTVRWYASLNGEPMRRQNPNGSWAVLPHGSATSLALDTRGWRRPDLVDLDLRHYVDEAWRLIHEVLPPQHIYQQQSFLQ